MKWKQILIGGVLAGIIIEIVDIIFNSLIQLIWAYNVFELVGMRTIDDPIMILFFVYPWILGFALAYIYSYFGKTLDGNYIAKGWKFGLLMWVVVTIPSAFLVFASMNYPVGFTVNSVIPPFIYMLVSSIVIAKTFDWMK